MQKKNLDGLYNTNFCLWVCIKQDMQDKILHYNFSILSLFKDIMYISAKNRFP